MARTYDEADREEGDRRRSERNQDRFDIDKTTEGGTAPEDLRNRDFEGIFRAFEDLADGTRQRRDQAADDFRDGSRGNIEDRLNIDFGEIEDNISATLEQDLSALDQRGLLEVIAQQLNNALAIGLSLTEQFSGLAAINNDIANNTETPFGIAVSGINDISDPRVEEPVVRNSDEREVEARVFKIRAAENNTSTIWIGDEDVGVRDGYPLRPGEELPISINLAEAQPFMVSEEAGMEVEIIGLV